MLRETRFRTLDLQTILVENSRVPDFFILYWKLTTKLVSQKNNLWYSFFPICRKGHVGALSLTVMTARAHNNGVSLNFPAYSRPIRLFDSTVLEPSSLDAALVFDWLLFEFILLYFVFLLILFLEGLILSLQRIGIFFASWKNVRLNNLFTCLLINFFCI